MIPSQPHSPTSIAAADSIAPSVATLRAQVLEFIRERGKNGATDEEVQTWLNMPGNTARPRRIELVRMGLVVDSGKTRKTNSRRAAVVWIVSPKKEGSE